MLRRALGGLLAVAAVAGCEGSSTTAPPGTVTLFSAGPLDAVAARAGDGPWQQLVHAAGNYRVHIGSGPFALAFVCKTLELAEVIEAYADEVSTIDVPCGDWLSRQPLPSITHRWQGTIRGVGPDEQVTVSFGLHGVPLPVDLTGSSYQIELRPGRHDSLAIAERPDGSSRVLRQVVDVSAPGVLDLRFDEAPLIPRMRPLALPDPAAGEQLFTAVIMMTAQGARGAWTAIDPGRVPLLDQAQLAPGDTQVVLLQAVGNGEHARGVSRAVGDGPLPALQLPPSLAGVSAALVTDDPVARPRVSFQRQDGPLFHQLQIDGLSQNNNLRWVVNASARWLGDRTSIELPDLTAAPGFSPEYGPPPRIPLLLQLTAVTSNRRLDALLDGITPPAGDELTGQAKAVVRLIPPP